MKAWNKISTTSIYKNNYWEYKLDEFETGLGVKGKYHYVHTRGSTMVIPISNSGKIILVKQYRYLNNKESIEFPCGSVSKGLSNIENAEKELREETGFSANKFTSIGKFNPYNGVTDEICEIFIAEDLFKSPLPKDPTENFEILMLEREKIELLIAENNIWDGMTMASWEISKNFINKRLSPE